MPYSNPANSPQLADLFKLTGKSALVVGGAGLLGSEIAFALAELGADVVVASRNGEHCEQHAADIRDMFPDTRPSAQVLDISIPASIKEAVEKVGDEKGIDILEGKRQK